MKKVTCPCCGSSAIKKNGRTAARSQRWKCKECGSTFTIAIDNSAKRLQAFLSWLLGPTRQKDMAGGGRTFRRRCADLWEIWPLPPLVDEIHRVVYVDGIWISRKVVVLIACTDEYVLGWYVAHSENSRSWAALVSRIAPPEVVVTDGGPGFLKAQKRVWPKTHVQRCVFHAFEKVKRYTTTRPRTQAGVDLYALAKALFKVDDSEKAAAWIASFAKWCSDYDGFLRERTVAEDGRTFLTHERLVKARDSLSRLVRQKVLFTYVDPDLTEELGKLPATNNQIEGGVNAGLRRMLRYHNGMSLTRRIKAVFWWCYMHTECPLSASEILKVMPTDSDIDRAFHDISYTERESIGPKRWGDAVVWSELHRSSPFRRDWD